MAFSFGTRPIGRTQTPQLVLSNLNAPSEGYILDPSLPILGHDVYIPNNDYIVIARGRALSIKNTSVVTSAPYANESRPMVTLANGADGRTAANLSNPDQKYMGFAESQYFRQYEEQVQTLPQIVKGHLVSLPYITASNGAYGLLRPGDCVVPYYGTANGNAPIAQEIGKFVKYQPRHVYSQHVAASGTVILQNAVYPAFVPNLIAAFTNGTYATLAGSTVAYDAVSNRWVLTLGSGTATDIIYDYGQDADQIAGQVASFEAVGTAGGNLSSPHKFEGWLEWVRDNFSVWAFPPLLIPRPYTNVTNETPTSLGSNQYQLAQFPIVPSNTITVTVTGTRVDPNTGLTQTLTNSQLPLADSTYFQDYTLGQDYEINFYTGVMTLFGNLTASSVSVSYSAETSFLDGKLYNPGIIGLTDGRISGVAGTPANLELAGTVADMHLYLR